MGVFVLRVLEFRCTPSGSLCVPCTATIGLYISLLLPSAQAVAVIACLFLKKNSRRCHGGIAVVQPCACKEAELCTTCNQALT